MTQVINYIAPPTIAAFIKHHLPSELFYSWIVGPVGSGKTTGIFMKLATMAQLQVPWRDGIRRTRAVVVRNTMPQLKDTTLKSWGYWFKDGEAGTWHSTDNRFILKFGDVECEVLFRPLDTAQDVARVLSLEVTFALLDEFVQIPKAIVEALSGRLGRYPAEKDGGATNWGMWGSSNPDTEDNWWYDHLHSDPSVEQVRQAVTVEQQIRAGARDADTGEPYINAKYFHQPAGLAADAENIDNLPGKRAYYTNLMKGKTHAWIKQFVEAEWGYSVAGKPVIPSFKADLHVAKSRLHFNPNLPLVIGLDPGLGGSALVFGQQDLLGRLLILGELVQSGYGSERLISERLKPYLRARFPMVRPDQIIIAPDPASTNRGQRDETQIIKPFKRIYRVLAESNNRLPLRIDALTHFTTHLADGLPALQIDPVECPKLVRALKGGWRFEMNKVGTDVKGAVPDKNEHSHVGDAGGYLARFFHRQTEREMRYGPAATGFRPPRSFGSTYHHR